VRLEDATILVVDDEAELCQIFSAWLNRKGCKVLTASNGVEALGILETTKIDVLLSDIRMPIMGGVALVRAIHQRKLSIPSIIFVSGFGDVEPREIHGLGVEALMEKPLSRKSLLDALDRSLMEREELWLTPSVEPVQEVDLTMESMEQAAATCQFQIGRGGCCFTSNRSLAEGKTIALSIRFADSAQILKVQGHVRWCDCKTLQTGISFSYIDPSCRDWVIGAIHTGSFRSYIPQCCSGCIDAPAAAEGERLTSEPDLAAFSVT
jgi:CheY-like chemotaxis protein